MVRANPLNSLFPLNPPLLLKAINVKKKKKRVIGRVVESDLYKKNCRKGVKNLNSILQCGCEH